LHTLDFIINLFLKKELTNILSVTRSNGSEELHGTHEPQFGHICSHVLLLQSIPNCFIFKLSLNISDGGVLKLT
jgi:hypothetical protein